MTTDQAVWLAAGAAVAALLAVLVALRARSRAADAELAAAALAERVAVLESQGAPAPVGEVPTAVADATTYVITAMDDAGGAAVPDALRGYKEIHLRALKLLRTGGTLATFCCSHHVDAGTFMDVILSAAYDAKRLLRRVAIYSQAPDHPVLPSIPETEYLKGFAFEVIR